MKQNNIESNTLSEEDKKKNKLITAYRIPMVGGNSYYGVAHQDPSGESNATQNSDGGGGE
jgi:hypothetical protein